MRKRADNLTQFGEANDKINRKQRHRKLCVGVGTTVASTWKRTTHWHLPFITERKSYLIDRGKRLFVTRIDIFYSGIPKVSSESPHLLTFSPAQLKYRASPELKQPVVYMSRQQPDFPMPLPLFVQPKRNKWKSWNIGIYGKGEASETRPV